jgi:hypothetical protein
MLAAEELTTPEGACMKIIWKIVKLAVYVVTYSVMSWTAGFCYEHGRNVGRDFESVAPKEFLSSMGKVPLAGKALPQLLKLQMEALMTKKDRQRPGQPDYAQGAGRRDKTT